MDEPVVKDYTRLPAPIRLEDTITSQDVVVPQDEGGDLRETAWMLRTAGLL